MIRDKRSNRLKYLIILLIIFNKIIQDLEPKSST